MSNNQLPVDLERIKADAEAQHARLVEHAENEKDIAYAQGFAEGWYEGATAERSAVEKEMETWNYLHKGYNKALEDQKLKAGKLAEAGDEYFNAPKGQYMYYRMKLQAALEQWRGEKEASNAPKPTGYPFELQSPADKRCHICGKEDCESDHK